MTTNEKAVAALTRMGPFSERQAERYLEALNAAELAELVAMHDEHATSPQLSQGGWFQDLQNNVADRLAREAAEKATPEGGSGIAAGLPAVSPVSPDTSP